MSSAQFLEMFKQAAGSVIAKSQQLSELDMIGDADFGVNISTGFEKVIKKLSDLHDLSIGDILTTAGHVFVFDIGSTIGGLLGRAFQRAGKQLSGKQQMSTQEFVVFMQTLLDTIQEVGRAKLGDKTLVDALQPAAFSADEAVKSGVTDFKSVLKIAAAAAEKGADGTASMVAKIGRASYLGERSRGTIDPGAMFISMFLNGMAQSVHA